MRCWWARLHRARSRPRLRRTLPVVLLPLAAARASQLLRWGTLPRCAKSWQRRCSGCPPSEWRWGSAAAADGAERGGGCARVWPGGSCLPLLLPLLTWLLLHCVSCAARVRENDAAERTDNYLQLSRAALCDLLNARIALRALERLATPNC